MSATVWSKFYWSDWLSDAGLRRSSFAAKGLWIDMLCIAAQSDPIGYLTVKKVPLSVNDIARMCGGSEPEVRALITELEGNGVLSRDRNGTIYSRRMTRDDKKARTAQKNGKLGGNPTLRNNTVISASDNHQDKCEVKPQIPLATSQKKTLLAYDEKFEEAWQGYPRRDGGNPKAPAAKRFLSAVKAGADPQIIIDGVKRYAIAEARNVGTPYIPQMVKWLGDQRWLDYGPGQSAAVFNIRSSMI
jgi:hypothetical protein